MEAIKKDVVYRTREGNLVQVVSTSTSDKRFGATFHVLVCPVKETSYGCFEPNQYGHYGVWGDGPEAGRLSAGVLGKSDLVSVYYDPSVEIGHVQLDLF